MEATAEIPGFSETQRINFYHAVEVIKQKVGLPRRKSLPVRELIRHGKYFAVVEPDLYCEPLNNWSLKAQLDFLHSLAALSEPEKIVYVYEKAYELCKSMVCWQSSQCVQPAAKTT